MENSSSAYFLRGDDDNYLLVIRGQSHVGLELFVEAFESSINKEVRKVGNKLREDLRQERFDADSIYAESEYP